jgi:uncharacterized Ntn-hydrolase superfamily protein
VIRAKKVLGAAYLAQGKLVESEEVLLEALDTSEELVGLKHSLIVLVRMELAKTYDKQGREAEAVALKKQVEEDRKGLDSGLSEEEWEDKNELIQDVIKWLEREVSGVV